MMERGDMITMVNQTSISHRFIGNVVMIEIQGDFLNTFVIVLAPFLLLWGKKFFKPLLYIICGFFGAYAVTYLCNLLSSVGAHVPSGVVLGSQIVVGLLFGLLVSKFISIGVIVLGGTSVMMGINILFNLIVASAGISYVHLNIVHGVVMLIGFLAGAWLGTFIFEGLVVPAITSILGGFAFVSGVDYWVWRSGKTSYNSLVLTVFFETGQTALFSAELACYLLLVLWCLLAAAGFGIQTKLIKHDDSHHHESHNKRHSSHQEEA
eukprot:TRINITY_DN2272_c0_g1_i1.p1 TRINITY_DN2272_c0_g1~~TRINITY_DN2272_c0_g1_i1.p1  ORF type:complete len:265 (-),score=66.70 TRINITY_DN2272_c0_g1_i1:747-1541(-)